MTLYDTPNKAWDALAAGNIRFISGSPLHPRQDIDHRESLAKQQRPHVALLGCSDSRLAAEIIFDAGLGDIFVVRTAGHTVDETVLGSLEYAIQILKVPLIIILGHDKCGAIQATLDTYDTGNMPHGFIRDVIEKIIPTVIKVKQTDDLDNIVAEHVKQTVERVVERSSIIENFISLQKISVIGLTYELSNGKIKIVERV